MPLALPTLVQVPPIMPIDLTALLAVFMGISIVLIPVLGITARFAPATHPLLWDRRLGSPARPALGATRRKGCCSFVHEGRRRQGIYV